MASKAAINRMLKALGALAVACFERSMDGRFSGTVQAAFRAIAIRISGIVKALIQTDLASAPPDEIEAITVDATAATSAVAAASTNARAEAAIALARAAATRANRLTK